MFDGQFLDKTGTEGGASTCPQSLVWAPLRLFDLYAIIVQPLRWDMTNDVYPMMPIPDRVGLDERIF